MLQEIDKAIIQGFKTLANIKYDIDTEIIEAEKKLTRIRDMAILENMDVGKLRADINNNRIRIEELEDEIKRQEERHLRIRNKVWDLEELSHTHWWL